jgi:DNA repair protein RadC
MDNMHPVYVREMTTRRYRRALPEKISGPDDVVRLLKRFRNEDREQFVALLLNARHEVIGQEVVSVGILNASIVHPREVFRSAVKHGAAAIIVAHNHPSGDPEPSNEDLSITKQLAQAGAILGIDVLDHVIIAERGATSFRNRCILP